MTNRICLACGRTGPWPVVAGRAVRCAQCQKAFNAWKAREYRYEIKPQGPCVRCGTYLDLTWDHIVPLSKGGKTEWSNLQPLCRKCNSSKGDS